MKDEVFLDSAYSIALSAPRDDLHLQAIALADDLQAARTRLLTTRAVALEIGNALAGKQHRRASVRLLQSLDADPRVEIIPLSDDLYAKAFVLYMTWADKEWGITDCISFVAMRDRGITEALTSDEHFRQAGFEVLLRRPTF
jgi:predicted nucleic acid-binding protein